MSAVELSRKEVAPQESVRRQASIDVYRGLVMFLMLAEVLELMKFAEVFPNSSFAQWLRFHTTHVEWVGCSLHDLIQPSFSFLVGVSLPFSIASRRTRGKSFTSQALHALWRSVLLIFIGVALRSLGRESTNFFFVDTLTQIGLGYFVLFLLGWAPRWSQALAVVAILSSYWAWFATAPLPPDDFDTTTVGVPADWPHALSGFEAHWNKNAHPAYEFDLWFMNLFPRDEPFVTYPGGYATLSFIPTLATMILGLLAGGIMHAGQVGTKTVLRLGLFGAVLFFAGWALGHWGYCPVVKRIWTPSWVLYSGGISFMFLGFLALVCDFWGWTLWAWPLTVIGANSIAAYLMSWTMERPIKDFLTRHLGNGVFSIAGEAWEHVLLGSAVLLVMWLILLWLYRQRIFIRI